MIYSKPVIANMNKALFLDRDGVVNHDKGHVHRVADFEFIPGIFELCKRAQALDYQIIIVTNQGGIARGMYTEDDFHHLMDWVKAEFTKHQITINDVLYCPHHPDHGDKISCTCRKPEPGMLRHAIAQHNLDSKRCIMIGDHETDMMAAQAAGISKRFLLSVNTSDMPETYATNTFTRLTDIINHL